MSVCWLVSLLVGLSQFPKREGSGKLYLHASFGALVFSQYYYLIYAIVYTQLQPPPLPPIRIQLRPSQFLPPSQYIVGVFAAKYFL